MLKHGSVSSTSNYEHGPIVPHRGRALRRSDVELTLANRLLEASSDCRGASGLNDVAVWIGCFGNISRGELIGFLTKFDVSPDRNRTDISAVHWVEPEEHYGVSEAQPAGVLPYSVAGAKDSRLSLHARCPLSSCLPRSARRPGPVPRPTPTWPPRPCRKSLLRKSSSWSSPFLVSSFLPESRGYERGRPRQSSRPHSSASIALSYLASPLECGNRVEKR